MARKPKTLTRPGERSQRTKKGLEIPVPTREEFFRNLGETTRKRPAKPSQSGTTKR